VEHAFSFGLDTVLVLSGISILGYIGSTRDTLAR
jgi:hypothetical protein